MDCEEQMTVAFACRTFHGAGPYSLSHNALFKRLCRIAARLICWISSFGIYHPAKRARAASYAFGLCVFVIFHCQSASSQTKAFQIDRSGTLTNGLQAYYKFDGDFTDFYNSNNLSCPAPLVCYVGFSAGKINQGVWSFAGGSASGDNRLTLNNDLSTVSGPVTVALWVEAKTLSANTNSPIFGLVSTSPEVHWSSMGLNANGSGDEYFYIRRDNNSILTFASPVNFQTAFHFVAYEFDGTSQSVWIDNVLQTSGVVSGSYSGLPAQFTLFQDFSSEVGSGLNGVIDEVGVWNRVLSPSELNDLYNGSAGQTMISAPPAGPPLITLMPSYVAFPNAGNAPLKITNSGSAALVLADAPSIIGFNASDFAIAADTTCVAGVAIPPGNSCTVDVVFTPTTESWEIATLTLSDNASYGSQTVPLSGGGQLISISPNPVLGSSSPQTITVSGIDFEEGATINWQDLTTPPWTGKATPQTVSPDTITASMNFTGASATWQIAVVNPGQAKNSPSRTSNWYALQVLGAGSATPSLLDDYPYKNAPVDAGDPYDFASDECTSYVAWRINRDNGTTDPDNPSFFNKMDGGKWGDAQNWSSNAAFLNYTPDAIPRVGDIAQWTKLDHVAYVERVNNPDGSIDVSEYNYGSDDSKIKFEYGVRDVPLSSFPDEFIHFSRLSLNPTSLNFGSQSAGMSSSQIVVVTNFLAQTVTFPSTGITVGASQAGIGTSSFTESDTCSGNSIPPDGQCQVTVKFEPPGTLTKGAQETAAIILNWGEGPQLLPVKGVALTDLNPSPKTLSFGKVSVGSISASQNVTLTNHTGTGVAISSISTGSAQFSAGGCTGLLPEASSCTISVAFSPTAKGKQSATLTIIDTATNSPQAVSLQGTGL
jgi:surface antigen